VTITELDRRSNRRQPRDSGHDHSHYIDRFVQRLLTAAVGHDLTLGRLNLMTNSRFKWEVRISLVFSVMVAGLIFGSRTVPGLGLLTLPFSWPGVLLLGFDETEEIYGYWGEPVFYWLCSLPCVVGYSWLICRLWSRASGTTVAQPNEATPGNAPTASRVQVASPNRRVPE
jgi:hypothetical protein